MRDNKEPKFAASYRFLGSTTLNFSFKLLMYFSRENLNHLITTAIC